MKERAHLEIRFDRYGDWCIAGRDGHIFADGKADLIVVMTGESVRCCERQKRLAFRRISQDGDDEGCLHLDRLPTAHEADLIRGGKRHLSRSISVAGTCQKFY